MCTGQCALLSVYAVPSSLHHTHIKGFTGWKLCGCFFAHAGENISKKGSWRININASRGSSECIEDHISLKINPQDFFYKLLK